MNLTPQARAFFQWTAAGSHKHYWDRLVMASLFLFGIFLGFAGGKSTDETFSIGIMVTASTLAISWIVMECTLWGFKVHYEQWMERDIHVAKQIETMHTLAEKQAMLTTSAIARPCAACNWVHFKQEKSE